MSRLRHGLCLIFQNGKYYSLLCVCIIFWDLLTSIFYPVSLHWTHSTTWAKGTIKHTFLLNNVIIASTVLPKHTPTSCYYDTHLGKYCLYILNDTLRFCSVGLKSFNNRIQKNILSLGIRKRDFRIYGCIWWIESAIQ